VVTVGADQEPEDLARRLPWSRRLGVEWVWLDRALYRRSIYYATAVERFRYRFQAPVVLLLDADVFVTAPLDGLVERVRARRTFHGLIAHVSPFLDYKQHDGDAWWARIFARAELGAPPLCCEHTAHGVLSHDERARRCPPYFNLGVLAAPAELMNAVGQTIYEEMDHVTACVETGYRCQIGLTLALTRQRVPWDLLPMRYNCPNIQTVAERYPREVENVHVFHYLGQNAFRKQTAFADLEHVEAFLRQTDLDPVNQRLQEQVRRIHTDAAREAA
jgi:hypothetical protein